MAGIVIEDGDLTITPNGFSTVNRHIREVANPADADMWMVQGSSIAVGQIGSGVNIYVGWRVQIGPLDVVSTAFGRGPTPAGGFNTARPIAL
jgi:hypothetical protein